MAYVRVQSLGKGSRAYQPTMEILDTARFKARVTKAWSQNTICVLCCDICEGIKWGNSGCIIE